MEQKLSKDYWVFQGQNKKGIPELRAAFDSVKSIAEKLKIFRKIEARLDENQLGKDCWKMAHQLYEQGQDPLQILDFGKRALNIVLREENNDVITTHRSSLIIASILQLLGYACFELKRFNESLSYLNWADRNLGKLLLDHYCDNSVLLLLNNVHFELSRVKEVMGRGDEVVFHLKKVLDIKEKLEKKGCLDIGRANKDVSYAYLEIDNFKEALSFSLKALEIYKKHLANDSGELGMLRMRLAGMYLPLGEFDKAFEQNRLSLVGLKSLDNASLLLKAEAEGGNMLVSLGRYEEAIKALKPVISEPENARNQQSRALAFMGMAKAFCRLVKLANARKYIKSAIRLLENKGLDHGAVASGFMEMAMLYEEMKEYEAAISLVQKALNILEIPHDYLAYCSSRLFALVSLSGTEKKRLPILEEVVERLKVKSGPEHYHVGSAYANLGDVYMDLGIPEMAVERLLRAKVIINNSLGPHHPASLTASRSLSIAYAGMQRYDLAVENQEKVVEYMRGLVPSEQAKVVASVKLLNILKVIATGEGSRARNLIEGLRGHPKMVKL